MRGHRTARVGSLIEHAPVTTRPEVHLGAGNLFMLTVTRPAWAYRVELADIALLAYPYWWLSGDVSDRRQASLIILAATAALMAIPQVQNGLATLLHRSHPRRRWSLACRHAELATLNDRLPTISRASFVPSGDLLRVRMPAGRPAEDLEQAAETTAAFLEVREVRVARDPANARYARVVVVRRSPLATKEKPGCWTRQRTFEQVRHGSNIQLLPYSLVSWRPCPGRTWPPPSCRYGHRFRSA
jgi:hypothetical protein